MIKISGLYDEAGFRRTSGQLNAVTELERLKGAYGDLLAECGRFENAANILKNFNFKITEIEFQQAQYAFNIYNYMKENAEGKILMNKFEELFERAMMENADMLAKLMIQGQVEHIVADFDPQIETIKNLENNVYELWGRKIAIIMRSLRSIFYSEEIQNQIMKFISDYFPLRSGESLDTILNSMTMTINIFPSEMIVSIYFNAVRTKFFGRVAHRDGVGWGKRYTPMTPIVQQRQRVLRYTQNGAYYILNDFTAIHDPLDEAMIELVEIFVNMINLAFNSLTATMIVELREVSRRLAVYTNLANQSGSIINQMIQGGMI